MSNGRVGKDDRANTDFKDRLKYVAKNTGNKTDRALAELLYGNYPNLNHKEFAICRIICDTLWDHVGDALYLEVQERAKHTLAVLFEDVNEIEAVIKGLIQNGIVRLESTYIWYGGGVRWELRPERMLRLGDEVESQVFEIISKAFETAMKEAFAPIDSESKES